MSPSWGPQEALMAGGVLVMGLLVGSFINVLIARIPEGQSIAWPGSRCPHCLTPIHWYDNVPLVSWLVLRGKCRACQAPISARYFLVELLVGLLFLASYVQLGLGWGFASAIALIVFAMPLTFIDLEHWILPFELTLPGTAVGLLLAAPQGLGQLRDAALGAAAGFFLFWAMEFVGRWFFKKEALGAGDKYLLAMIGAFLTYRPMLGVVMFSSLQGSVIGLVMLAIFGRAGPALKAPVPAEAASDASQASESQRESTTELLQSAALTSDQSVEPAAPVATPESPETEAASPPQVAPDVEPSSQDPSPPVGTPSANGPVADEESSVQEPGDEESDDTDDWQPGPTNMPFGPWLALSAMEVLLLAPTLARHLPPQMAWLLFGRIWES